MTEQMLSNGPVTSYGEGARGADTPRGASAVPIEARSER
jgi:hypothetical protein